jgi:hypothetical protein
VIENKRRYLILCALIPVTSMQCLSFSFVNLLDACKYRIIQISKVYHTLRYGMQYWLTRNMFESSEILYFLAHLTRFIWAWAIVTTERPSSVVRPFVRSVNVSHFNQLLWSHWANLNQTLVEWSLDGPLPKVCPVIPTSNQDGHQAKNRKKGGWNFELKF